MKPAKEHKNKTAEKAVDTPSRHESKEHSQKKEQVAPRLGIAKLRRLVGRNANMKNMFQRLTAAALLCVCGTVYAAQDTSITQNEVRDPRKLATYLVANATDAESRLVAAGATSTSSLLLTNGTDTGTCYMDVETDRHDDAGDWTRLLWSAAGLFSYQTDQTSKGTLATKISMDNTGIVTMKGGATLDNTASATELNITEDNVKVTGILKVTGVATNTGTLTLAGGLLTVSGQTETKTGVTVTGGTYGSATLTAPTINGATLTGTLTGGSSTLANSAVTTTNVLAYGTLGVSGETTLIGKYPVYGPDATTALMVQNGTYATNGVTITFPVVFGAAPIVVMGAAESTTTVPYPSSVTASNFVANGEAAKTLCWHAIGTRP